jgi:acetyl esterase/lipase
MRAWKSAFAISAALLLALIVAMAERRPIDLLNALGPRTGYQRAAGIAYGDRARQRLDLYRPAQAPRVPAPVVVFFYGGGWRGGNRADSRFVGQFLAGEGFVAVIPDYRVAPEAVFPGFLEDGAKALRWVQDHIAEQGGDPRNILLMGHSAGAYNAVMLALDRRYGSAAGFDATRLRGVVGLAGPYDFELETGNREIFGAASDPRETQPVHFAASGAPPVLLVTGTADETVDPENSRSLARHLAAAKSPVTLREIPGLDHMDVALLLSRFGYPDRAARDEIVRFLKRPGAAAP